MNDRTVTFETAKLAKERGFNEEIRFHFETEYPKQSSTWNHDYEPYRNSEIENGYGKCNYPMISAPTQSILQEWLRNKHFIHIHITQWEGESWYWEIQDMNPIRENRRSSYDLKKSAIALGTELLEFDTYEKALEIGLLESLKLIDSVKTDPIECSDKHGNILSDGDFVNVQQDGTQKIYTGSDGELYFKPYDVEDRVANYFSNDLRKCDVDGDTEKFNNLT